MSYRDGWAAVHLEMPARIPRTEYSADAHYELVSAVTGISVRHDSPPQLREQASDAFIRAWNYDFIWNVCIGGEILSPYRTSMGHAVYADGGTDWNPNTGSFFNTPEEVLAFDPAAALGRIDRVAITEQFSRNYREKTLRFPEAVNMTGIYVTCVSGLIEMFGWDLLLCAAGEDADAFGRVCESYGRHMLQYFEALADCTAPVVMVHDDLVWTSGPFLHPDFYRQYIFPCIRRCIAPLREAGKRVMFTSDGNFDVFVDDLADCGVNGFVLEPTTGLERIAEKYGKTHVLVGNADTRILLGGSRDEIETEVRRCMDIGRHCPGFFMAVGNHIPSNTPVEACLFYNECYEKYSRR